MTKKFLAIDLGGSYTSLYLRGEGLVLREPTLVLSVATKDGFEVKAIGNDAKAMEGRTNNEMILSSPISNGVVANEQLCVKMLKHFLKKIEFDTFLRCMEVVCVVPCSIDADQANLYLSTLYQAGLKNVTLVPSAIATALGGGKFIHTPLTYFVVDVGGSYTDICVINSNQIVKGCTVDVGGNMMDKAVAKAVEDYYKVKISNQTAKMIKEEIGTLFDKDSQNIEVVGVDVQTLAPKNFIVVADVVKDAIYPFFEKIAQAIATTISTCSPNISADINQNGIFFGGGVSAITGLESFMRKQLKLNVYILQDNDKTAILGAGKLLSEPVQLNEIMKNF